eukprot:TRINITY_DN13284_c0_g1_i2.p1 TRINITY_DN13284_c0_g1~~TRINITY_DN13284_c0_g1_i2.p1  ORF type:complete len:347 (+),score=52.37 TRINITY_DN13284_c0_g1_i2:150-1190(+)
MCIRDSINAEYGEPPKSTCLLPPECSNESSPSVSPHHSKMISAEPRCRLIETDEPMSSPADSSIWIASQHFRWHLWAICNFLQYDASEGQPGFVEKQPLDGDLVALTRGADHNPELASKLQAHGLRTVELPCVEYTTDQQQHLALTHQLKAGRWDLIVVTSPHAAGLVVQAWRGAGRPQVHLASLGSGTSRPLLAAGLTPVLQPAVASVEQLAELFPSVAPLAPRSVLWPTTEKASSLLEDRLCSKGYSVNRLNVYNTKPADELWDAVEHQKATRAGIVAFASPSAVRVWVSKLGTAATAACIGKGCTAKAASEEGFDRVVCAGEPGVAGLVRAILEASRQFESAS